MAERFFTHAVKIDSVTEYVEYLKDTLLIVQSDMTFEPFSIGKNPYVMISYLNDVPVLTDASGVVSYEYGSAAPTYITNNTSTFVNISDGDSSSGYTLTANTSAEDMNTVGTFDIIFTVVDSATNTSDPLSITFTITDTVAPEITLAASVDTIEYSNVSSWDGGVANLISAMDAYDGDITANVVITYKEETVGGSAISTLADAKTYLDTVGHAVYCEYNVDDSSSNSATLKSLTITSVDTTIPIITDSIGDTTYEINTAEPNWATGVTATDGYDGSITGSISINSTAVNMAALGTFDVLYDVDDANGNSAVQVVRTITINDSTIPVITATDENVNTSDASAWTNSATAADATEGDISGSIVVTYFKADGTTPLTLSQAKIDLYAGLNVKANHNVTDSSGNDAIEVITTLTAVDNTIPVIIASSELINVSETAAWDNSATAIDNKDGAITPVVATYFESDNSTGIGSLALFRTYLNNSGAGATGYVRYNVDDAASNSATQVTITVTASIA